MDTAVLLFLPAALLLDSLLGEPPAAWHPVCGVGRLALWAEGLLRRGPNGPGMFLRGLLACLLVVLPCLLAASLLVLLAARAGLGLDWLAAVLLVYVCLAPRSLAEHALRVAAPLRRGDVPAARRAVSLLVGRRTEALDAHGVARACVESVAENMTDGVLATLFWAACGLLLFGLPGAAACAALHRAANVLDAMWGKRNDTYRDFGTAAARLDDLLNALPARLSLPCTALAALLVPGVRAGQALLLGWRDRHAHESPNSAWSEAAFAGALGLRLGGPAVYGDLIVEHPWLGAGTPQATERHILLAVRLMRATVALTAVVLSLVSWGVMGG